MERRQHGEFFQSTDPFFRVKCNFLLQIFQKQQGNDTEDLPHVVKMAVLGTESSLSVAPSTVIRQRKLVSNIRKTPPVRRTRRCNGAASLTASAGI